MQLLKKILTLMILITMTVSFISASSVRIKDITRYQSDSEVDLIGYGLIIGLDGSGDGKGTQFTIQSLANMMERMGLTIDPKQVKVKNVAAVIVTAKITSANKPGSRLDVTVSSVGDASSLQGGMLLLTPMSSIDGTVYAVAQGAVSIGGFNVQLEDGNKIVNNYTLVGRVTNGALVQLQPPESGNGKDLFIGLSSPDYTTSARIVSRINKEYGLCAFAVDEGTVRVRVPDSLAHPNDRIKFISRIGRLRVSPDQVAKIVINEKTGTIVAGRNVSISPVALAHGNITINIRTRPVISQPDAFSSGETVLTSESMLSVEEEMARVIQLPEIVTISQVASALNAIGATPRDIISIFLALKENGALRAELVLM
ncbi:MAG: flagellar basal body P-ring protein FlgI [candidate division Zixibacteria bacterium]|nr:flagellar basal body P-ring protein FlgI [candidate division Zixibacteria bacterium]